ncbi:MAG: methionyl-tRNA formyltransferase [Lachnospiraceae bacterium]|nr:methionyl-tRNA formyltransferase [Lachnospiraceae bacterium]
MKVVFMGTPDFSVHILEKLIEAGHEICAVVTQEDKPRGRGRELSCPPVKECAVRHGIEVFQPHILKCEESERILKGYGADIFVVAAYGKILSHAILNIPKYGCINVHASLLPKYRGASPIQWSIINGDEMTGVTIMQMDEGLDTGDILLQRSIKIDPLETGESLFDKLAELGASLAAEALDKIETGEPERVKQDEAEATYTKLLNRDMGKLDFGKSAAYLERLIRGMYSWPGAYCLYGGKKLKVFNASVIEEKTGLLPGTIAGFDKNGIKIATSEGILNITELQLEGKKRLSAADFILGFKFNEGDRLE